MIRIGIIGCNHGRLVHLPAFRHDPRCVIVALAGTDAGRTAQLVEAANIPLAFGNWENLVAHPDVDAITIAALPRLQPQIALQALALGKPVFAEKPIAADPADAEVLAAAATASGLVTMVDFNFSAVLAFRRAKDLLDDGAIGRLRHVAVSWQVENYSTKMRLANWKTAVGEGGGVLGNFVSHSMHYLEWLCGPINALSAHLSGLPDAPVTQTTAAIALRLASGAAGHLTMSCAAYNGSGHRLEFYGEDGTMTLVNPTRDYMRGFQLHVARRPATALTRVEIDDSLDRLFPADGRIAPVARLAAEFLDAIQSKTTTVPGFAEGLRVQTLLEAARRANNNGGWLDIAPPATEIHA